MWCLDFTFFGLELTVMAGPEASEISAPEKITWNQPEASAPKITKTFQVCKMEGPDPYKAILGGGFSLI